MSLRNFLRRNIVADDPQPADLGNLDRLDGLERSMADRPAGKRRPAATPAPESLEEATSDDDLLAVARGAGVLREEPHVDPIAAAAMRHFRETNDLDGALRIYATRDAS
jgi:hypothetical protein